MSADPAWTPQQGRQARRDAALRMLPLADGRHDPDLEPIHRCHICHEAKNGELVKVFGQWMCESRTDCYNTLKKRCRL